MKTKILFAALIATLLVGCDGDDRRAINEMRQSGKAIFQKEAEYDGCDVGQMKWANNDSHVYYVNVYAVICHNKPSTSLEYRSGKHSENVLIVGEAKSAEQIAAEKEASRKGALNKLSEEDKQALGLK